MTRGKSKRILTPGEVDEIKSQRAEAVEQHRQIGVGVGTGADEIDKSKLNKQINYYDRVIDEGKAPKIRGDSKDRLANEAKAIRERVTGAMLTRAQMDHPAKHPGVVHKQLRFMKDYKKDIQRYKEIQRTLEPNDPTAVDLEQYRKEK